MKPSRFCAFSRRLLGSIAVTTLTFQASADPLYWDTSANGGSWSAGAPWSTNDTIGGADPASGPGINDVAYFTVTSPPNTAQTVNLNGDQSVSGLVTASQTFTSSILAGTATNPILNLGAGGIVHARGGLTIGSTSTPAQAVNVNLLASQEWSSDTAGGGAAAIVVHNNVSSTGSPRDLILKGINTGTQINGNITDGGAGAELKITKRESGTWSLAGAASTFGGNLKIEAGTIRLSNGGAATPSKIEVLEGAILAIRGLGTATFSDPQFETYRSSVTFRANSILSIDTNNSNYTYAGTFGAATPFKLDKSGGNTLTLTGNNSAYLGSTSVTDGTLALAVPNAAPGPITVETNGTLAAVAGSPGFPGFTVSEIGALITATTFKGAGSFGISTANGDTVYPSVLSGAIRFNKTGLNTLVLTADNTYTGATVISGGSLSIPRIANGGTASPIGASPNGAGGLVLNGGRLVYTGPAATTNRLFSMSAGGAFEASGTGALVLGAGSITHSGTSARNLTLSGINRGENTIPTILTNSGSSPNLTSVIKTGYGKWNLTGANTYTGFTRVRGGNLTLENLVPGSTALQTGTLHLKATSTETSSTVPILQLGESHDGLGILKLTGGFTLNVTSLDGGTVTQRLTLVDLSDGGGTVNVSDLNSGTAENLKLTADGLLLYNAATLSAGRANTIVRASDGTYGFAALPATLPGPLQKLGNHTVLTPGDSAVDITNNAVNYFLGAGTYSTSGAAVFSTLTLDSTNGPVNLGLVSTITASGTGKAILATGSNDISITGGTASTLNGPTWFHNFLEPSATLNIAAPVGNSAFFIIGGTGYTNYSGVGFGNSASTDFVQNGGVFRATGDQDLKSAVGNFRVNEGVFEIGADLNGALAGDFTRTGDGTFRMRGSAGFSAYTPTPGGLRVANLGDGTVHTALVWGTANFLSNPVDTTDTDNALLLGSARSNATVEFQNSINLGSRLRAVDVANGDPVNGAAIDAVLSGVLSGTEAGGLVKMGAGTLALTGQNTYLGETRVMQGVLRIQPGSVVSSSRLRIESGAQVHVTGTVNVQSLVINGVEQNPGTVNAPAYVTGTGSLVVGGAPVGMTYAQWVTAKSLQPAESDELFDADFDGLLNILEYGLGSEPKTPNGSLVTHNAGNAVFRFNRATDRTDIVTVIESSETMTGTWSTTATSTGTGPFVLAGGVTGVAIDESTPGTVIVTSSGTMPSKKFHRVRVTKP